jgi:hypothetical protein
MSLVDFGVVPTQMMYEEMTYKKAAGVEYLLGEKEWSTHDIHQ